MTDLAKWRSHKIVRAGIIRQIDAVHASAGDTPDSYRVHCHGADLHAGSVIKSVPPGVFMRLVSETGGTDQALGAYLVIYDDGHISWSPKEAFEEGYKLLGVDDGRGGYIGLTRGEDTLT